MSNLRNYRLSLDPNQEIIKSWFAKWKRSSWIERFMYLWISFNAIYEGTTIADWNRKAWTEFIEKDEVKKIWEEIKYDPKFTDFLTYLRERKVRNKSWILVQSGWIYNMKNDTLYSDWNYWDNLWKYIWIIYQIRNNLFHWWKSWDDSDSKLIEEANKSFLFFLDKLYWFSENP